MKMTRQELAQAVGQTKRIKLWGKISATLFLFAALAVLDGLQSLARHDFNSFDLIPGETTFISGMLPEGVTSHEDLVIRLEGADGVGAGGVDGLTVRPVASFKGFWLGGQMWRAEVTVPDFVVPGKAFLTVVDLIRPSRKVSKDNGGESQNTPDPIMGEEVQEDLPLVQNPMLVYAVTIWPNALARQKAEKSMVRRLAGFSPFWLAGFSAVFAILAGIKGWFTFGLVEKTLARRGLYIVHGVKKPGSPSPTGQTTESWQALCAYFEDPALNVGDAVFLIDNAAAIRGEGVVREMKPDSFMAAFPTDGTAPVYSWLVVKQASMPED